jgi:hypothetical protein
VWFPVWLAHLAYFGFFFVGSFFRVVLANSSSCFSLIDSAFCLESPLSDDFLVSPRLAARARPRPSAVSLILLGYVSFVYGATSGFTVRV